MTTLLAPTAPARQLVQDGVITAPIASTAIGFNTISTVGAFPLADESWIDVETCNIIDVLDVDINRMHYGQDFEIVTDHAGWVTDLAKASIEVLVDMLDEDDPVVHRVEFTGETWSPRDYMTGDDGYMARWTLDCDALERWLVDNDVTLHDGHGISGFRRTAPDDQWFLARGLNAYLHGVLDEEDYHLRMRDHVNECEGERSRVIFSDALCERLIAEGADVEVIDGYRA